MKFLTIIILTFLINCLPDLTSDKESTRGDDQRICLLSSLLYVDRINSGTDPKNIGLVALSACDDYLNWDQK